MTRMLPSHLGSRSQALRDSERGGRSADDILGKPMTRMKLPSHFHINMHTDSDFEAARLEPYHPLDVCNIGDTVVTGEKTRH